MAFAVLDERKLDKEWAFPITMISLASSLGISESFFKFNEKTIEEIAPCELFEAIKSAQEKAKEIQNIIDEKEAEKKKTMAMIVKSGGTINDVISSIDPLLKVENPLRKKLICLAFIIEWIENLIEKQKKRT